jgi:lipid II:glycine glycyltransferase (peptidoglycan interpeptide bridge formation enzyme)
LRFSEVSSPKIGGETSGISTHWLEDLENRSEQELLNSFRKTLRHEIQNAQKNNIQIRKCANEKEIKQFYNLYLDNLRRKRTIPYPWSVFQFLCQNLSSELLLAFFKGKIVAGSLFLKYNSFIHYFLSASDYQQRNLGAAHLLLWTKIKDLINKNVIFDLGATPKNSSLNVFKSGWGGREYPILQIGIKREDEFLRSSRLRNFWKLLPNWLIKILSSKLIKYRL